MLGSTEDAEDVLQEVFVAAYNAMVADERPIAVRPWLYRISRNRCLNHLRKPTADGQDTMDTMPHMNGVTTLERVQNREEFRNLLTDVGKLPETQRSALLLREIDAMSYEEIAQAMDTTVPGVKSLLVRARIALAESSQARQLTCDDVRLELAEAAEGIAKVSGPVRRHLKTCDPCREFRSQLRSDTKAFASIFPAGPLLHPQGRADRQAQRRSSAAAAAAQPRAAAVAALPEPARAPGPLAQAPVQREQEPEPPAPEPPEQAPPPRAALPRSAEPPQPVAQPRAAERPPQPVAQPPRSARRPQPVSRPRRSSPAAQPRSRTFPTTTQSKPAPSKTKASTAARRPKTNIRPRLTPRLRMPRPPRLPPRHAVPAATPPLATVTVPPQPTDPAAATPVAQTGGTTAATTTGKHKHHKNAIANSDSQPSSQAQTGPVDHGRRAGDLRRGRRWSHRRGSAQQLHLARRAHGRHDRRNRRDPVGRDRATFRGAKEAEVARRRGSGTSGHKPDDLQPAGEALRREGVALLAAHSE